MEFEITLSDLPLILGCVYLAVTLWRKPWRDTDTRYRWLKNSAFAFLALAGFKIISPSDVRIFEVTPYKVWIGKVDFLLPEGRRRIETLVSEYPADPKPRRLSDVLAKAE